MCDEDDDHDVPTLRGWLAYRWLRVRSWFRRRVLRQPSTSNATLKAWDESLKEFYAPESVNHLTSQPNPLWGALEKWIPPGDAKPPTFKRVTLRDDEPAPDPLASSPCLVESDDGLLWRNSRGQSIRLTASQLKHGPRGRGGPGPCDADCLKCQVEKAGDK